MEICNGIKLIEGLNRGKFPYCNVLKVGNVLIDSGAGIEILENVREKVDVLLLSHTHPDHASGAWLFQKKKVFGPDKLKTDLESLAKRFVGEHLSEIWTNFVKVFGMKSFEYEGYEAGTVYENPEIEAIPVLGHSADHHVFLVEQKVLFGSDVDLTSFGPWYGNPESDPYVFKKEIEKLLDLDFEIFVSAHSKPVFSREEAVEGIVKFMEKFDEREGRILELLGEPRTIDELVEISPIYGKKPYFGEILDFFEKNMILKHLEKLVRDGRVRREGEYYVRA
ncbi:MULTISPECIES: MBL fold metallo-hydrolase [unclassified Archaeoglobus]|jgi:glyoxylase-like metal-dependent hydrolase (beta-lactamase superfamily II)|uniref:MBL fold metallo-hydrolase n=1 Tax=unclassified Archaeoglobus TaxID=2643606 RepID=UPI0025C5CFD5|nr:MULTISPECIES: MBL fold metallo-hydrolase [unclassified Archaeoglobus]